MGFGVAEFIHLFDLQAPIIIGDHVQSHRLLDGHASIRALHQGSGL